MKNVVQGTKRNDPEHEKKGGQIDECNKRKRGIQIKCMGTAENQGIENKKIQG